MFGAELLGSSSLELDSAGHTHGMEITDAAHHC